jgi:hypothetical protein
MKLRTSLLVLAFGLACLPLSAQQGQQQIRLDDALVANTPDGFDLHLENDGDLWVATWVDERDPVNTFDDDIFMAVSTDGGKTWAAEQRVTNYAVSVFDIDDNWLEVSGNTIYVSYDEDSTSGAGTSHVLSSTDFGATWTDVTYIGDLENPRVFVDGSNVLVLMYDGASSPNPIWADFSTTGAAGLGVNPLTQVSNVGSDGDFDGYYATVVGGTGHITFMDDINLAFDDDLWYVSLDFATGAYSAPVQVNTSVHDVDTRMQIVANATTVHFMWYADDNIGAVSASDDVVFTRTLDIATGTFGAELMLTSLLDDSDFYQIGMDGNNVCMAFADDSSGDDRPSVAVSTDAGATYAITALPQFLTGIQDAQSFGVGVSGEYMFVISESDSYTASSFDELPIFWYSNDTGTTWYGPFLMGQGFEADEDIDSEDFAWNFTDNGLAAIWQTDGGAAFNDALMFSSIAFPYTEVTYVAGVATFTQVGNPVSTAGEYARWGVSTTLGTQVHPENPGLTVDLGPSGVYNFTTSVPPIPPITTTVGADGSATMVLNRNVGPGTYYIQAWTNPGSLVGGRTPGDVFGLTL